MELYENKVKHLDRVWFPKDKFIILAGSVLVLHGLIETNTDLDMMIDDSLLGTIALSKDFKMIEGNGKYTYQSNDELLELVYEPTAINASFADAFRQSIESENGYHFLSIDMTIEMYKNLNRDKDKEKIQMLEMIQHIDTKSIREQAMGMNMMNHIKRGI